MQREDRANTCNSPARARRLHFPVREVEELDESSKENGKNRIRRQQPCALHRAE
jgi:hypothetical protein